VWRLPPSPRRMECRDFDQRAPDVFSAAFLG
jgi:hypothetical protein